MRIAVGYFVSILFDVFTATSGASE